MLNKLAAIDDEEGFVIDASMSFDEVDTILRDVLPEFFSFIAGEERVLNPHYVKTKSSEDQQFLPPYVLVVRKRNTHGSLTVLPAAEFPTGKLIVEHCQDTAKRGWAAHTLVIGELAVSCSGPLALCSL